MPVSSLPTAPESRAAPAAAPLAVYVHWPFCRAKCPYCDFNSHVRETVDEGRWRRALLRELDHFAALLPGREVVSVFFGGGTPSLMAPDTAAAVLQRIAHHWPLARTVEITLEANPTSVEADRFEALAEAGVNRLSLGIQALRDTDLQALGRQHGAAEALRALETARRSFPRVSFDLIYARPGQTPQDWDRELRQALALAQEHLSLYQLTIEKGTAFHLAHERGRLVLPDEDSAARLYALTQERCEAAGLPAYEVSNHARPGRECRHNLVYWRGGEYLGVGPGAHGRLDLEGRRHALAQRRRPEAWLAAVEEDGHGTEERAALSAAERREELLMMGLRLREGIRAADAQAALGSPLAGLLPAARLAPLAEAGYLEMDAQGLRLTAAGRPLTNAVLGYLLA